MKEVQSGSGRQTDVERVPLSTILSGIGPDGQDAMMRRGSVMPELLTAATYLVVWLICWRVIGIESGLIKLILSLGAAIFVFVLLSIRDHQRKKRGGR